MAITRKAGRFGVNREDAATGLADPSMAPDAQMAPGMDSGGLAGKPPGETPNPFTPTPDPTSNSDGNRMGSTELNPGGASAPPVIRAPGEVSTQPSGPVRPSQATPSMPNSPTPVASEPPRPFTPMSTEMSPTQTAMPGITRRVVPGGAPQQNPMLLGKAGGLLGGGLGVPGMIGGNGDPLTQALLALFQQLGR